MFEVLETRMPDPVEAVALNADEKVLRIEMHDGHADAKWELAMSEVADRPPELVGSGPARCTPIRVEPDRGCQNAVDL